MKNHSPLKVSEVRWQCLKKMYSIGPKKRSNGIAGQERAIRALQLGIEIYQPGYSIFVSGITGTGRTTAIEQGLEELRRRECPYVVDDGLEILTDIPANEIHLRAKNRIEEMAQIVSKSHVRYEGS